MKTEPIPVQPPKSALTAKRFLTPKQVEEMQTLAFTFEQWAEELRCRAVTWQPIEKTGLADTLLGLRNGTANVAEILSEARACAAA